MKHWIVFYTDNGGREDCSVYYCWVVQAESNQAAIQKVCDRHQEDPDDLDAEPVDILV